MKLIVSIIVGVAKIIASLGNVASVWFIFDEPKLPEEMIK